MKIVCYINKLGGGGAERVMSVLANGLSDRGHDVTVVTDYSVPDTYPLRTQVQHIVLDGRLIEVTAKGRMQRTLRRVGQLRRIIREKKADIVISFMRDANYRAILAARGKKTKNLISVRIDPKVGYRSKKTVMLAKLFYPLADGCVFQTADAQNWFSPKIRKRSQIIFNPISDVFYSQNGAPMAQPRIVACGRLTAQKNFGLLIDAFDCICDDFPAYMLEIYGEGPLAEQLQMQIGRLGRNDRISLMGRTDNVPNALKDASLFVLSSDFEGLPNALMEAMALGLPVISTDCSGGGARALIDDGKDGLIVPCADVEALSQAMRDSLSHPDAMRQRGQNAACKAAGFSAEHIVCQWEDYISLLVKGNGN